MPGSADNLAQYNRAKRPAKSFPIGAEAGHTATTWCTWVRWMMSFSQSHGGFYAGELARLRRAGLRHALDDFAAHQHGGFLRLHELATVEPVGADKLGAEK